MGECGTFARVDVRTVKFAARNRERSMCKKFREYMGTAREYTREFFTFGGILLMCFVYNDFRELVKEQSATAAKTAEILRTMDERLSHLEYERK